MNSFEKFEKLAEVVLNDNQLTKIQGGGDPPPYEPPITG